MSYSAKQKREARVRRHFRPQVFKRLPAALRRRYAEALGILPEALDKVE